MDKINSHVAVRLNLGATMGRRVLGGIIEYSRAHGQWRLLDASWTDITLDLFKDAKKKGLVTHLSKPWDPSEHPPGLAAVNIGTHTLEPGIPSVVLDEKAVGRAVADYFASKRLTNFAFIGYHGAGYSDLRCSGYLEKLHDLGFEGVACPLELTHDDFKPDSARKAEIQAWLQNLESPTGLLAANDHAASGIVKFALDCGISVPEQLAVVGVDDDEVICEMAEIPISSVSIPRHLQGYQAAALLDILMDGKRPDTERVVFQPGGIITRLSSEVLADASPTLARAVYFIEQNANNQISVKEVAHAVNASRRYLERQFREVLGRSPYEEITRARLKRAKELMRTTKMSLTEIADASGFREAKTMTSALVRTDGLTPSAYLKKLRDEQEAATPRPLARRRS